MKISSEFTILFKLVLLFLIGINIFGKVFTAYFHIDVSQEDFAFSANILSYSVILIGLLLFLPSMGKLKSVMLLFEEKKIYLNGKKEINFRQVISIKKYYFIYGKIIYQEETDKLKTILFLLRLSDIFKEPSYIRLLMRYINKPL